MLSRQSLELRQSQQLALTPQLQQSIRFLQISAQDLEAELAQALEDNPLLELDEEYDTEAMPAVSETVPIEHGDSPVPGGASQGQGDDDYAPFESSAPDSLAQHLLKQLQLTHASRRDRALLAVLIDDLDENGYLVTPLQEILGDLPDELDVDIDELRAALRLLQSFDPPGVGASSLSECLLLQLEQNKGAADPEVLGLARKLVHKHLDLLAGGNLNRLREALSCTEEQLRAARMLLLGLDPKPGRAWAGSQADYINPEIIVRKVAGRWQARLNGNVVPRVRVNALYEKLLRESRPARGTDAGAAAQGRARNACSVRHAGEGDDGGVAAEAGESAGVVDSDGVAGAAAPEARPGPDLHSQLQSAHGLVKSVAQRFETILRVAQVVVERQQAFFEQGPQAMRPLLLRDIALELEMHESTVSRATRQKYMQTPWGVFELKFFFGAALDTDSGDATSATAVRSLIQKLVAQEKPEKPLSDSQLMARLAEQGVVIARRTVAKYREAAGIETAALRKARAQLKR